MDAFFEDTQSRELQLDDYADLRRSQPDRNFIDTIATGLQDSHVTPLYYVFGHFWVSIFGDSIAAIRAMSAAIGVAAIAAIFWCTSAIAQSARAGAIAAGLMASSPFMVVYSQEARMYSLWCVAILVSHACFVRALQVRSMQSWLIYGAAVLFSAYSHLLTVLVTAAQAAYVAFEFVSGRDKRESWQILRGFGMAMLVTATGFLPWIYVIVSQFSGVEQNAGWLDKPTSVFDVASTLLTTISATIAIFPESYRLPFLSQHFSWVEKAILVGTVLLFCSIFAWVAFWMRNARVSRDSVNRGALVAILLAMPIVNFALPAAVLGKTIGTVERYYLPLVLAMQIGLAICIHCGWQLLPPKRTILLWYALCVVSTISSYQLVTERDIWSKGWNYAAWQTIEIVSATDEPTLVVTGEQKYHLLTLSYYLDPETQLIVAPSVDRLDKTAIEQNLQAGRDVFTFLQNGDMTQELGNILGQEAQPLVEKGGFYLSEL